MNQLEINKGIFESLEQIREILEKDETIDKRNLELHQSATQMIKDLYNRIERIEKFLEKLSSNN